MEQTEQRKTIINVTNIQSDLKKITLLDGKLKFFFWITKKDGADTKAYEGFQNLKVQAGKAYEAEVEFEEKEFTNEKGKNIKFTSRKILYFYTGSPSEAKFAPTSPVTPIPSNPIPSEFKVALEAIRHGFKKRDEKIAELETRLLALEERPVDFK